MMRYASDGRPLPTPTDTSRPFFEGAREKRLVLQRCPRDGFFFYPRSHCPSCLGVDWQWETVSGRGSVHAFTVDRVGHDPALASQVPFAVAIVELDEGPRMSANIVGCEVDAVSVGMRVEAAFEDVDDITLVRFRPCGD
ncbi:MAG: Zn-ribbon domain-containing OB-fold protein [Deltaproteobacteria bacterium]|nr:Zn-ribbon domain-containing OB-fold protein [Deltaproteobacteria bacterium]MBW2359306.1 Zn-ribbon domain-containing OB-fold protein [Deltaproteobacteria bacterium]